MLRKLKAIMLCLFMISSILSVQQVTVVNAAYNPSGFVLIGYSTSSEGASWTYNSTDDGISYQISGILFKPAGKGPFPAVIINHGKGGTAASYSKKIAKQMVKWGLVCIATNYTHAAAPYGVGSPGTTDIVNDGCSVPNLQRAHKCMDILNNLGYVDMKRVAVHGHSKGAWLTVGFSGMYSLELKVASHTAGGLNVKNGANAPFCVT